MAFTSESEIWCYALLWKLVSKVYVQIKNFQLRFYPNLLSGKKKSKFDDIIACYIIYTMYIHLYK